MAGGRQRGGRWEVLRHHEYRRYAAAQTTSMCGTWIVIAALPWLAIQSGYGAAGIGALVAARFAPAFFNFLTGKLADRFDRRHVIAGGEALAAMASISMAVAVLRDMTDLTLLMTLAFLCGLGSVIAAPSHESLPSFLVGEDRIGQVTTTQRGLFNLSTLSAPLLAAGAMAAGGIELCFLINAVSCMVLVAVVTRLRLPDRAAGTDDPTRSFAELVGGKSGIRSTLAAFGAFCILGPQVPTMMPLLATSHGGGPATAAALQSLVALGGIFASAWMLSRKQFSPGFLFTAILGTGVTMVVVGASSQWIVMFPVVAILGMLNTMVFVSSTAIVLRNVGRADRGKAMGMCLSITFGGWVFGSALVGLSAGTFGIHATFVLSGLAMVATGVTTMATARVDHVIPEARLETEPAAA